MIKSSYVFPNPGFVKIRKRVPEQNDIIKTDTNLWLWEDCGMRGKINWETLNIVSELKEALKGFVFHRLSTMSPRSIISQDSRLLSFLSKFEYGNSFPWPKTKVIQLINKAIEYDINCFWSFKMFYQWATKMQIQHFYLEVYQAIIEIKSPDKKPYKKVFLSPDYLTIEDETIILNHLENFKNFNDYFLFRDIILLQLSFELAPRASQIHTLNIDDLEKVISPVSSESYYCLWLPMAKKLGNVPIERRPRKITQKLGEKIEKLMELDLNCQNNDALFKSTKNKRMSSNEISTAIINMLKPLEELSQKIDLTLLRHHLAQSLANQGASAEIIAEIMGHNSVLPARAYIAATPEIAKIKTRALGKNGTYDKINKMLMTGKIIEKENIPKERWIKGMVGSQYIGGIGSCGLTENTACPKNPIYSCYTCPKFHPFKDGQHAEVKKELQKQAQFFVDIAQKGINLEHNRPAVQLERTIEAVNKVINRVETND